jgi:rhodanese-related sulfurtransferase
VARQLRAMGFDAYALAGGYRAWKQAFDVEPLSSTAAPTASA